MMEDKVMAQKFNYGLAAFWSCIGAAYLFCITFFYIPKENLPLAQTVLGFILGTIISQILGFYFGTSKSSQSKDEIINTMATSINRGGE